MARNRTAPLESLLKTSPSEIFLKVSKLKDGLVINLPAIKGLDQARHLVLSNKEALIVALAIIAEMYGR
jgi:hypothetical protein